MIRRLVTGLCAVAFLASCAPTTNPSAEPTTSTAPSATATPTSTAPQTTEAPPPTSEPPETPIPTPTILPESELPLEFPVDGSLLADADRVVERLHGAAGSLPVLRVDLTRQHATLTALLPDNAVVSFRWEDDQITLVDSDIQYLEQATFDPHDFPLDSAERMFDVADLEGVRGDLVLQIVEYRAGQVAMVITSRPETETLFFNRDGTAVTTLGVTSVADITAGLADVLGDDDEVYAVGLNPTRGYWADLPGDGDNVVVNRTRVGGVPVFETSRTALPPSAPFDPAAIRPEGLAKAIAQFQETPDQPCDVLIDMSLGRSAPVVRVDCEGTVSYADLDGRDMTALVDS